MNILVVEDNKLNAQWLLGILKRAGHTADWVMDAYQALGCCQQQRYDAVLTDWLMPGMDGMELIRHIRAAEPENAPVIIVTTVLDSPEARHHALNVAGADAFITKPFYPQLILQTLDKMFAARYQPQTSPHSGDIVFHPTAGKNTQAPWPVILIAGSTGATQVIQDTLKTIPESVFNQAVWLLVQHGQDWMIEAFTQVLQAVLPVQVQCATQGMPIAPGTVVLAPADHHMVVHPSGQTLRLNQDTPENFARPAADPLFRSAAQVFGKSCTAVILSGLGRDGSLGASSVVQAGGNLLVQKPVTAIAPFMPNAALSLGLEAETVEPEQLAKVLIKTIQAHKAVAIS